MRRGRGPILGGVCALLLFAAAPGAGAATKATECEGQDATVTAANIAGAERTLLCLTNVYRAANGIPVLTEDPALMRAARRHSEYQESTGQLGHDDVGDGTPSSRAAEAGFDCGGFECVGENVLRTNFPGYTPVDLLRIWRESPGHDANLRDPRYLTAGMGIAVGGNNGITGTQNFAIVDNGATGTASDLLTNDECNAAGERLRLARDRVAAARKKVAKADGKQEKARARAKLRRAKKKLAATQSAAGAACDLSY